MKHPVLDYIGGYVRVRIRGYSPERFLNLCCYHGLRIWDLRPKDGSYELCMPLKDFFRVRPIVRKTRMHAAVIERRGVPFLLAGCRKRLVFLAGAFLCACLLKIYPLFVWDIHFEGNVRWTDETLMEFLEEIDVFPGMTKETLDCPMIASEIRKAFPDIVWVSASSDGSRLRIQVKENEDLLTEEARETDRHGQETEGSAQELPRDLVASSDGTITEIVTRAGVPKVHEADVVKKGDLLVLGRVEVLNDSGEVTGYQYRRSDADVFADMEMPYHDSVPLRYEKKVYDGKWRAQVWLQVCGRRIAIGTTKNGFANREVQTQEKRLCLGENFRLPISFGLRLVRSYETEETAYTEEEIRSRLTERFDEFCDELLEKGVQIRGNSVKIHLDDTSASASGTMFLNGPITQEADTEIITIERKEPDESVGTDY